MFLAIVVICSLDSKPSNSTCIFIPSPSAYSTENECFNAAYGFTSSEMYVQKQKELDAYTYDVKCVGLIDGVDL